MGYSFDKELHALDSDDAADCICTLARNIVKELKKQEKEDGNSINTDGMVNVAIILQDCFNSDGWNYSYIMDYVAGFIPRFEKYIEKVKKEEWDDEGNKKVHLDAYKKILRKLNKMVEDRN